MAMSLGRRIRKVMVWGTLLVAAVLLGGVAAAYFYVIDSDNIAAILKAKGRDYAPGSTLSVVRAQLRPILGDVTLHHVSLHQRIDGKSFPALEIPWLRVKYDAWESWHGRAKPTDVEIAQPLLRLKRRADGTWNVQGLLASPWPKTPLATPPNVGIRKGTVELFTEDGTAPAQVLSDVAINVEPTTEGTLRFEGSAKGDAFDRVRFEGEVDPKTGRLSLTKGSVDRLVVSQTLRRLPPEVRAPIVANGVTSGEVDLTLKSLTRDPGASPSIRYEAGLALRGGTWACPKLPFPLDNVEISATVRDGAVTVQSASGRNGKTRVRAKGTIAAGDPAKAAMDLEVSVFDLELDQRLRAWTPPKFDPLWDQYKPNGWIDAQLHVARHDPGVPPTWGVTVFGRDVGLTYHLFPYPIEHAQGTIDWVGNRIRIEAETIVGGKPVTAKGTIVDPGPKAVVNLDFTAGSMPIDETLLKALPPAAGEVVRKFHPTGSARGEAHLRRTPPVPGGDPKGDIDLAIDADLNDGCAMKWDGMPYPVSNLTGHLAIRPDHWVFTNIRGENGPARFSGQGRVDARGPGKYAVDLDITADDLSFDPHLRRTLPQAWQPAWATLNPSGSSKVVAKVVTEPGKPDHYRLEVVPKAETRIQLELTPMPGTPVAGPSATIKLPPMEDVQGKFVFNDGVVTMNDVRFSFHEAPVRFASGTVRLKGMSGEFDLAVNHLEVSNLRLDADLRKVMPPLMQDFSRRLDDGKTFRAHAGYLGIAWLGAGQPGRVEWRDTKVAFNGNTIQAGIPLGQIQGQAEDVEGQSDGRSLSVSGFLKLESIDILGQQLTKVETPVKVGDGWARLEDIEGDLLGGKVYGSVKISLAATPTYEAVIKLQKADLAEYTKTLPGKQTLRGLVSGKAEFSGQGNDLHTLSGKGDASVENGDLGKLPWLLSILKLTNFAPLTTTAFDSAFVDFTMQDGLAELKTIKLTGDAINLQGSGTLDPLGDLDVRLGVSRGRAERFRLPILSDLAREAGSQLVAIHLVGPVASPKPKPVFFHNVVQGAAQMRDKLGERKARRERR